jgi:hypothetical protein
MIADSLNIPATVTAIDAATSREEMRTILADWRAAHWDAWEAQEKADRTEDAAKAIANGDDHLTEWDGSWRVDYLPSDLHRAEVRALSRIPAAPAGHMPEVYYRARTAE